MNTADVFTLTASLISLIISSVIASRGWWKQRNIYDIERIMFFKKSQIDKNNNNDELKLKLNSGHYTILHTGEYGGYIELILGKIRK